MQIDRIDLTRKRNDEHFQFHVEVSELVNRDGAVKTKIETLFAPYLVTLGQIIDEAILNIAKSALTDEIKSEDSRRDNAYGALVTQNRVALKHFDPDVQTAARRLKILFDTYGNVSRKPFNEQTSAVYNILQELQGKYADDCDTTGITAWATELQRRNNAFSDLMRERFDETAGKTDVILKDARTELDRKYREITERINALAIVEGAEAYEQFIRSLNAVIAKYNAEIAARKGKAEAKKARVEN
jgi:hypothetical protein